MHIFANQFLTVFDMHLSIVKTLSDCPLPSLKIVKVDDVFSEILHNTYKMLETMRSISGHTNLFKL